MNIPKNVFFCLFPLKKNSIPEFDDKILRLEYKLNKIIVTRIPSGIHLMDFQHIIYTYGICSSSNFDPKTAVESFCQICIYEIHGHALLFQN